MKYFIELLSVRWSHQLCSDVIENCIVVLKFLSFDLPFYFLNYDWIDLWDIGKIQYNGMSEVLQNYFKLWTLFK